MNSIKSLKSLKGKTVLVRADFNVPIDNGKVRDSFRIKKALPTIEYLHKKGARIIIVSHAGDDGAQSLAPVAKILKKFAPIIASTKTVLSKEEVDALAKNAIVLLENIRREDGEKSNSTVFAKQLAAMADVYVNDAFSVSHRTHASIVGVTKYLPSYAGLQLEAEIKNLSSVLTKPVHPFLFILGGAKFETKLPLIKKFLKTADAVFITGALANNFFKTAGYEVGASLVEEKDFGFKAMLKNKKLLLPIDVTALSGGEHTVKTLANVLPNDSIMDIGGESVKLLKPIIESAKLVLWNGPTGVYELGFDKQTKAILKLLAISKAKTIIGGGDTVEMVNELKLEDKFAFVSTGGGATLEFLAKGTLPGIKALK